MWLCFNDGFLSVVADKNDPTRLMIRARRKKDLANVLGPDADIIETPDADYRWRAFINRKGFKALVDQRIDGISYTNFKASVKDHELHDIYITFWGEHRR